MSLPSIGVATATLVATEKSRINRANIFVQYQRIAGRWCAYTINDTEPPEPGLPRQIYTRPHPSQEGDKS